MAEEVLSQAIERCITSALEGLDGAAMATIEAVVRYPILPRTWFVDNALAYAFSDFDLMRMHVHMLSML